MPKCRAVNWARECAGSICQVCATAGAAVRSAENARRTSFFMYEPPARGQRNAVCAEKYAGDQAVVAALAVFFFAGAGFAALAARAAVFRCSDVWAPYFLV